MRSALVVFAVLVSLSGCGLRKPTSIQIDPALARLVPSDTVALAGVKVDAVRSTPLYRKFIEGKLSLPEMSNDVSEVLVASNGKDVLVFAKTKSGVVQLDEHGRKSEPRRQSGGVPPALREKMRAIPPEVQIWAAGIGAGALPSAVPQRGNLANLQNLFNGLESWIGFADLRSGLKMDASAVYRTEQDARQIHDALRGLVGLGRLSTPDNAPELLRLYDGIHISMERNNVRVSAEIPADVLEKSLQRLR